MKLSSSKKLTTPYFRTSHLLRWPTPFLCSVSPKTVLTFWDRLRSVCGMCIALKKSTLTYDFVSHWFFLRWDTKNLSFIKFWGQVCDLASNTVGSSPSLSCAVPPPCWDLCAFKKALPFGSSEHLMSCAVWRSKTTALLPLTMSTMIKDITGWNLSKHFHRRPTPAKRKRKTNNRRKGPALLKVCHYTYCKSTSILLCWIPPCWRC